jgi:cytochrome P450
MQQLFDGFDQFVLINQSPVAALLDAFPILRNLPDFIIPQKRTAKHMHEKEKQLYLGHWLNAKRAVQTNTANPCFSVDMAREQEANGFSDEQAAYVAGSLLEAGSDTTSSTLYGFVQAMVLFPEVQKQAQEELDRVVGPNRLPTLEDEPDLPYIRCCVKEALRWMPSAILGFPHALVKDDEYMGYVLPKGAGVMLNVYGIHMDPVRYPEPRRFNPDRYKGDQLNGADSAANADATVRDHFVFGAGRRVCQGIHVTERSLFLSISRLLWAFNFSPATGADGKPLIPDAEKLTQGFVCRPETYPAKILPRSKGHAEVVKEAWKNAQELLEPGTMQWKDVPAGIK